MKVFFPISPTYRKILHSISKFICIADGLDKAGTSANISYNTNPSEAKRLELSDSDRARLEGDEGKSRESRSLEEREKNFEETPSDSSVMS